MRLIKAARALTQGPAGAEDPKTIAVNALQVNEILSAMADYLHPIMGSGKDSVACRSCGASIMFIRTPAGKNTPVDATPIIGYDADGSVLTIHLSHFATCPYADRHRSVGFGPE